MNSLTHINARGDAHMVDISTKPITTRIASAAGWIDMQPKTLAMITGGNHTKGDVLGVARLAGITAAKRTAELIPLCHPLRLTAVTVEFNIDKSRPRIHCTATTKTCERTGVEIEALLAVQIALLTIYDMCKAVDRAMVIGEVRLNSKSGGKSGDWQRAK